MSYSDVRPISWSLILSFSLAVAILFSASVFARASASETVAYGPAPSWAEEPAIPDENAARRGQSQDGVYYLLADTQSQIRDDSYTFYRRTALKVVNRSGLENAARLQYSFDPLDDNFSIHRIRIIRDGVVLDRLNPKTVIVARRENDMANGVTDGDLTVYYEIPDVRVGDIIEYAASWETHSPIWPGQFSGTLSMEWSVPVEHLLTRILLREDRELHIKNLNTEIAPVVSVSDGWREYRWEQSGLAAVAGEDFVPQTYSVWGMVSVSTFKTWREVSESLLTKYEQRAILPDDFTEQNSWLTDKRTKNERITAAIRYVQDNIRYVADETGVGSHLPRKPEEVIARGWGDCKDKSLLLKAIFNEIGIEAYVALTDLDEGYALSQKTPSPYIFDHAIVVFLVHGKPYWIDPTNYQQGGVFPDIAQPAYGFGLPVKANIDDLWPIEVNPGDAPQKIIREIYNMEGFATTGVTLNVKSVFIGREADSFRRIFSASSRERLSQDYLDYYQSRYPGLMEANPLKATDDREANRIEVIESYNFAREHYAETDFETNFPLRADAVLNVVKTLNLTGRKAAISLTYPLNLKHVIELQNIGRPFSGADSFEEATEQLIYKRADVVTEGGVTFEYSLKTTAPEMPISESKAYSRIAKDLDEWGYFEYQPNQGFAIGAVTFWDAFTLATFGGLIVTLVYLPFGIVFTFKKDNLRMENGTLHPISLHKFIILNILTFGTYGIFWMWRCWRWVKNHDASNIMPFWRAFFSAIWMYPLFSTIREYQEGRKAPAPFGVLLTIGFIVLTGIGTIGDRVYEDDPKSMMLTTLVALLAVFCLAPLVFWVNALNKNSPDAIRANSRWRGHTIALLGVGAVYWALVIIGVFAPG